MLALALVPAAVLGAVPRVSTNNALEKIAAHWACTAPSVPPCRAANGTIVDTGRRRIERIAHMRTHSMVTLGRRIKTVELTLAVLALGIPGDVFETGVFRGGTAVLMLEVLRQYGRDVSARAFWAADSFSGLPDTHPKDRRDEGKAGRHAGALIGRPHYYTTAQASFEANLEQHGVMRIPHVRLHVLPGWFNETLPRAGVQQIAFLRLDGDVYSSTMQALNALYDKVSPGGLVYIDDYGTYIGCRNAVNEFRRTRGLNVPLVKIGEIREQKSKTPGGIPRVLNLPNVYEGVWFQKPA